MPDISDGPAVAAPAVSSAAEPLDDPADESVDERFGRLALLIGDAGLSALRKSRVMVAGVGGVGASCAEALARAGVGSLILVDADVVERSNINRQAIAFESTVGLDKVDSMARMARDINPGIDVRPINAFIDEDSALALIVNNKPDYVVDCIDSIRAKIALVQACHSSGIPIVSAMGAGNKLDPMRFEFADISETSVCPLCRLVRKGLRKRGIDHLRVLYSKEQPLGGSSLAKPVVGTISYMPPIMGLMLAGDVTRQIIGLSPL